MTISAILNHLIQDPYGKYSNPYFRSIDGVLFTKRYSGWLGRPSDPEALKLKLYGLNIDEPNDDGYVYCGEPHWVVAAVIEDGVLLTTSYFHDFNAERNRGSVSSAKTDFLKYLTTGLEEWRNPDDVPHYDTRGGKHRCDATKVPWQNRIHIRIPEGYPVVLRPRAQRMADKYGMIRMCIEKALDKYRRKCKVPSTWGENIKHTEKEWFALVLQFALCGISKRIVDAENKFAGALTKVAFDVGTDITPEVDAVQEALSDSDYDLATECFHKLQDKVDTLHNLIYQGGQDMNGAFDNTNRLLLPCMPWYDDDEETKESTIQRVRKLSEGGYVHRQDGVIRIQLKDRDLFEAWKDLSVLCRNLGMPVSPPHGVDVIKPNRGKLAALYPALEQEIVDAHHPEPQQGTEQLLG